LHAPPIAHTLASAVHQRRSPGAIAMSTYNTLLSGDVNLYNVGLGILAVGGLGTVGARVAQAIHNHEPVRYKRRVQVAIASIPIAIGAVAFVVLALIPPIAGVPMSGAFHLLPAAFLAAIGVLALFRPTEAGSILALSAGVAFIAEVAIGITAGRIDPAWVRDGLDSGSLAVTTLAFCLPAMLTAIVLLTWAAPAGEAPWSRRPRTSA
jgi:hypothetical protein